MKNTTILSSFLIGVILASPAIARPVSYPGGWTVMQMNDSDSHSLHVHYSPNAHYSIGYKGEYFQDKNWQFHGAQLNYLVKRWNATNSQANVYAKNAVGLAYSDNSSFDTRMSMAGFTGLAADWETRRWFTSYENRYVNAGRLNIEAQHCYNPALLRILAQHGGMLRVQEHGAHNNLNKQKQLLSDKLKTYFQIEDDPIMWVPEQQAYKARFVVC